AVPIRLAIREANSTSSTPGYCTTAVTIPNDGQWHHAVFSLAEASLTPINSPQPYATDIAQVNDFRICSSAAPSLIGDAISGQVGVDNISTYIGVPEPGSVAASAALVLLAGSIRRRRQAI